MYDLVIRKAIYKDIPVILELLYYLGRPKSQNNLDSQSFANMIKQYIENSDKDILVALYCDTVIGMVSSIEWVSGHIVVNNFDNELQYSSPFVFTSTYVTPSYATLEYSWIDDVPSHSRHITQASANTIN